MKIVKKIFLMGLSSILSLGVISSSSLGYASYSGSFNSLPKDDEEEDDLTRINPIESVEELFFFAKKMALATALYEDVGEEVDQILEKLKEGKLGKITDPKYKLPDAYEFIVGMMANREALDRRLRCWEYIVNKCNMKEERRLFVKLFDVLKSYLMEIKED